MEPQIKPSIRKQFLSRIYQRNPVGSPDLDLSEKSSETYQQEKSFVSNVSDISTTTDPKVLHETQYIHSSTTSIPLSRKNSTPGNDVENMQVFIDFLKNLQDSNGEFSIELMQRVFPVTKALNDNFSKNPEFSLQFYISMTGIINALEDPESINFPEFKEKIEEALRLTNEGITEIEQLTSLKKHISKVSLKIITTLQRLLSTREEILVLCHAYLSLFCEADKAIEIFFSNKKIPVSRVLSVMQKYTLMPGKMIQTCRKIVDFIHQKQISPHCVKYSQESLSRLSEQGLIEIDRSGGILILFEYLKACVSYYWVYNQSTTPAGSLSPSRSTSPIRSHTPGRSRTPIKREKTPQKKRVPIATPSPMQLEKHFEDFDEYAEIEEEIFKNESCKAATSEKIFVQPTSSETARILQSPNEEKYDPDESIFEIDEEISKKGEEMSRPKGLFERALEDRFKEFLRQKPDSDFSSISMRIQLLDLFEREIRDEIRNKYLGRVIEFESLASEIRKVNKK